MQQKKIFQIKEGSKFCYDGRGTVLNVCELDIYAGEIVVILGNSGAGKSTFIETLGLMSDTLHYKVENKDKAKRKDNNKNEWDEYKEGELVKTGEIIFDPDGEKVVFPDVWKDRKSSVSEIRRENFNFIFQDNNLMHNLKNSDNIILADLIEGSKNYDDSYKDTQTTFKSLNIDQYIDDPPNSISGGERQRVAFARGIQPKYRVLFGDEPTGNLDEAASKLLMDVVRKNIEDSKECENCEKAVVIVSHNIPLSLDYATKIVVLTKSSKNNHYEILPENIYTKIEDQQAEGNKKWRWVIDNDKKCDNPGSDNPGKAKVVDKPSISNSEFASEIKSILEHNVKEKSELNNHDKSPTKPSIFIRILSKFGMMMASASGWYHRNDANNHKISKQFIKLLFEKESEVLAGKRNTNIWVFSALIFITFMILGFANGQMNELQEKLITDPFTKTIDVSHRGGILQDKTREFLIAFANNEDSMKHYGIKDIAEYDRNFLTFYDFANTQKHDFYKGRSMRHDNPLLDKIVDERINNAVGRKFADENDMGLIVTRDLLKDLHYDLNTPVIYLQEFNANENRFYRVPISVVAVVDHLPGKERNYFLYTPGFYKYYENSSIDFPLQQSNNVKVSVRYEGKDKKELLAALKSRIDSELKDPMYKKLFKIRSADVEIHPNASTKDTLYDFTFYPRPPQNDLDKQIRFVDTLLSSVAIHSFLKEKKLQKGRDIFQSFYYSIPVNESSQSPKIGTPYQDEEMGYVSFLFESTNMIREFAKMFNKSTRELDEQHEGLVMDISKVESMHVFNKVSSLTTTILIFLISFSIGTIMFFVYNLLNMHLYKIRKNIGTLMAFGINVKSVYKYVLFSFTFLCFSFPFIISIAAGYLILDPFSNFSLFAPFDRLLWTIGSVLAIFIGTFIVFKIADNRYFNKTPSKLIFKS